MIPLLVLALALPDAPAAAGEVAASTAAAKVILPAGPRCPEGTSAFFMGRPFKPTSCLAQAPQGAPLVPAEAELPLFHDRKTRGLKDLVGRWEGLAYWGPERFEVFVRITRENGGYTVQVQTSEYLTHFRSRIDAEAKDGFFSRGRFEGKAWLELLPEQILPLKAWLGSPRAGTGPDGLDRELVVSLGGPKELHRLRFTLAAKDRLRYSYRHRDEAGRANAVEGELRPSPRETL